MKNNICREIGKEKSNSSYHETNKEIKGMKLKGTFLKSRKLKQFIIPIVLVVIVGIFIWNLVQENDQITQEKTMVSTNGIFNFIINPFLALITSFLALALWMNEGYYRWKKNLPKRLTFHIKYKGNYILTCHKAFLAGESDIRAWSQSIGSQLAGGVQFQILPFFKNHNPKILAQKNELILHYETTIFLDDSIPLETRQGKEAKINTNYLVCWDNENTTPTNNIIYTKHNTTPISEKQAKKIQETQAAEIEEKKD